jgi:epoxyqueuosine reductase
MSEITRRQLLGSFAAGAIAGLAVPKIVGLARHSAAKPSSPEGVAAGAAPLPDETVKEFEEVFTNLLRNDPRNALAEFPGEHVWDDPVFGYASVHDPLFKSLGEAEGFGSERQPAEWWLPGAKSIISFYLPYSKHIRDNKHRADDPGFVRLKDETNKTPIPKDVQPFLLSLGGETVVPGADTRHYVYRSKDEKRAYANWSERHVAYIAGLGTFGLHGLIITEKGSAGRLGSIITTLEFKPTTRTYTSLHDNCPFLVNGGCGACIPRCPPVAISDKGKDISICATYNRYRSFGAVIKGQGTGCGKCATAVPCEDGIPARDTKAVAGLTPIQTAAALACA